MIDLVSIAKKAGEIAIKETPVEPTGPMPIKISFRNSAVVDAFIEAVRLPDPVVVKTMHGAAVGCFATDKDAAQALIARIETFKDTFNDLLLSQPFDPDWLKTYLDMKDFSINYCQRDHQAKTRSDLERRLKTSVENECERAEINHIIQRDHEEASAMTFDKVVADLSSYIIDNFTGYHSEDKVRKGVFAFVKQLEAEAANMDFLNFDHAHDVAYALETYHRRNDEHAYLDDRRTDIGELYDLSRKIERDQRRLYEVMAGRGLNFWGMNFPDLEPKSFAALQEDKSAGVGPISRFKGLSLSGFRSLTLEERLNPRHLVHRVNNDGFTIQSEVSSAITAYVYTLMELKHTHAYREALIDLSTRVNEEGATSIAGDLVKQTRPSLYNGERFDRNLSGEGPGVA